MKFENPITFTEPSFIVFNVTFHSVATNSIGHLAIFSTKNIALQAARATENATGDKMTVLAVQINLIDKLPI